MYDGEIKKRAEHKQSLNWFNNTIRLVYYLHNANSVSEKCQFYPDKRIIFYEDTGNKKARYLSGFILLKVFYFYIFPITYMGPIGVGLPFSVSSVTAKASTLPKFFIF